MNRARTSMGKNRVSFGKYGGFEALESRQYMSGTQFRSIDGSGNNLINPLWGSAGQQLIRIAAADYSDDAFAPAGDDRPSAREISNVLVAQTTEERVTDDRYMSAMIYGWGQFLDHDIDLTPSDPSKIAFNIEVPADVNDPFSTAADPAGPGVIPLNRSLAQDGEQVNVVTAYIDGSMIYGSDATTAKKLRTLTGGKLKTSPGADGIVGTQDDLLPFNSAEYFPDGVLSMDNPVHAPTDSLFAAGDVRANENIELTALHTLFVREHNRLATIIAKQNPRLSDEQIYQQARAMVGAEIQSITYNQWLPTLLGRGAMGRYTGYDPNVNAGIANEFSTAMFRVGHTMLGEDVEFLDNDGEDVAEEIALNEGFFNPGILSETDIGPVLKYLSSDPSSQIDSTIVDAVRNFLFGPPGAGGFDLASLNIQRGRDHGLADYNSIREAYGLARVTSFSEISSDPEVAAKLESLYGSVDNIDAWVGALAEDHVPEGSVGELIRASIKDQFTRLRSGDRFWYQRTLSRGTLYFAENRTLADVIADNTPIDNLQNNVFFFDVQIRGSVFGDRNANGRIDFREGGLGGWTVELLNSEGDIVDTTTTLASGKYNFSGLELDTYEVRVVMPDGWKQTTRDGEDIKITRGQIVSGVNYGFARTTSTSSTPRPRGVTLMPAAVTDADAVALVDGVVA